MRNRKFSLNVSAIWILICSFIGIVAFTGCATYVGTHPRIIDVPIQSNIQETITVVISQEDLEREEAVSFGIVGFLFPVKVKVGEMLKSSATDCFNRFFNEVKFGDSISEGASVALKIEEFYIFGIDAKAHLKLLMTIANKSGEKIIEKSYVGSGSAHAPMYLNEANQRMQVSKTTEEAFYMVFNEIVSDLESIKFSQVEKKDGGTHD